MKNIATLLILIWNSTVIYGQTLEAKYKIIEQVYHNVDGRSKKIATLDYVGYLYRNNNKYISYDVPSYLDKYPDGAIEISENNWFGVCGDSLQSVNYKDLDSCMWISCLSEPGKSSPNNPPILFSYTFEKGFQEWKYFPIKKTIQGLVCQKATMNAPNGKDIQWEVWFCPDVPMGAGIDNIFDVPGLIVEADCPNLNRSYSLISYNTNIAISKETMWPGILNYPIVRHSKITKPGKYKSKSKLDDFQDINNQ